MTGISSLQMFFKEPRPERLTLETLNPMLGFCVDSLEVPIDGAIGFAQVSIHAEGYVHGWLISWPDSAKPLMSVREAVQQLAKVLAVAILLEPDDEAEAWLLLSPGGDVSEVGVEYLDDGIDVEHRP